MYGTVEVFLSTLGNFVIVRLTPPRNGPRNGRGRARRHGRRHARAAGRGLGLAGFLVTGQVGTTPPMLPLRCVVNTNTEVENHSYTGAALPLLPFDPSRSNSSLRPHLPPS